jgi:hypothetical protein
MRSTTEIQQDLTHLDGRIGQLQTRAQAARQQAAECESERHRSNVAGLLEDPTASLAHNRREAEDLSHEAKDCDTALCLLNEQRAKLAAELSQAEFAVTLSEMRSLIARRIEAGRKIASLAEQLIAVSVVAMELDVAICAKVRPLHGRVNAQGISRLLPFIGKSTENHVLRCLAAKHQGERILGPVLAFNPLAVNTGSELDAQLFERALIAVEKFSDVPTSERG